MRKVTKIFFGFVSAIILSLIIVPLLIWLLLMLPSVQNFVVRKATAIVTEKLQTTVSIDRIEWKLFSTAVIEGFYVEGYDRDTLLYVGNLSVGLGGPSLLRGRLDFGDVSLSGAKFHINQNADSTTNLKNVIDRIKRAEPREDKRPFHMTLARLDVSGMDFRLRKHVIREREYGVNFDDMNLRDVNIVMDRVSIDDDSVTSHVRSISLRENSGFELNALSARNLTVSGRGMVFDDMTVETPDSYLNVEHLSMLYSSWEDLGEFVDIVDIDASIKRSDISFRTIGYFSPNQAGWETGVTDFTATMRGKVRDMRGTVSHGIINDATLIRADYAIRGIPEMNNTLFRLDIDQLETNAADINTILTDVMGKPLEDSLLKRLANFGEITVHGNFDGTPGRFIADASVSSRAGTVTADLEFKPAPRDQTAFTGNVKVSELSLEEILGNTKLGLSSVSASLDGRFSADELSAMVSARLDRFDFNGYRYGDISLRGLLSNRNFKGEVNSSDPNINFAFDGLLDFNDSIPRYDFGLKLYRADLFALNLNKRDSISLVHTNLNARGSGTRLDNLNADIVVHDLVYINHVDSIETGQVRFTGRNSDEGKYLAMRSEFTDAEFRSRLSYSRLFDYFSNTLSQYLPSLVSEPRVDTVLVAAGSDDVNNYSFLTVNFKHVDNIARIFLPGLIISEGSKLHFMFNPVSERFTLNFNSDYIERGNSFITNLNINTLNQEDSISLYLRADELFASGILMPGFSVIGGARDNQIYTAAHFSDTRRNRHALIGVNATLGTNGDTGIPQVTIRTTPSTITYGNQTWNIYGRAVADSTMIDIRNFRIQSSEQSLRAQGVVSSVSTDTLHIDMRNFDLGVLSQFTESVGYTVEGQTNGHLDLISLKSGGMMYADIKFDSVRINDLPVPDADFESRWDFEQERARFILTERASSDTVLRAYFRPTDRRYLGKANLKGIQLSLLTPFFDGVLSDTEGKAYAEIDISGQGGDINFSGDIKIPELNTKVDFLNVPYSISDGLIRVSDNIMTLQPALLRDPTGNTADVNMKVDLRNFRNISYEVNIRPNNLLVVNTTERDNDLFYGRVFASGNAVIRGDKRGVDMDITATTSGNSEFYMPLSDKSDISEADFITFVRPRRWETIEDTTDFRYRRRMILERNFHRMRQNTRASSMNIDMTLNILPNLSFNLLIDPLTGHSLTGRGNGTLSLHIDPVNDNFSMIGDYEISEGIYNFNLENIIQKPFVIEQGSYIQWTGDPLDAMVNISAVYRLKTSLQPIMEMVSDDTRYSVRIPIDCRIMLTDRLTQLNYTFNISAPSADTDTQSILANLLSTQEMMAQQFFFLLASGSFVPEGSNIGLSTGSNTAIDFLTNQLSNWISSDKFNLGVRYRPRSEVSSDEFGIDYSQQFFNNRLIIEAEGNYDTGNNSVYKHNARNVTGDFYVTWLIDRTGNLKAKAFSRTIDRFDENQGLQESGLGIYYNEYFNSYRDIIQNLRDRFTGERRRRLREAQRQADIQEVEMLREEEEQSGITLLPLE